MNAEEADESSPSCWKGVLMFPGKLMFGSGQFDQPTYQKLNLLEYTDPLIYRGSKIIFDPMVYPTPRNTNNNYFMETSPEWKALKEELFAAAKQQGYDLIKQSCKKSYVNLICQKGNSCSIYQKENRRKKKKRKVASEEEEEEESKTMDEKPEKRNFCPFRFNLGATSDYYFMSCGSGCPTHRYHVKQQTASTAAAEGSAQQTTPGEEEEKKPPANTHHEEKEETGQTNQPATTAAAAFTTAAAKAGHNNNHHHRQLPSQSAYSQTIQAYREHCNNYLDGRPDRIQTFLDDMNKRAKQYNDNNN